MKIKQIFNNNKINNIEIAAQEELNRINLKINKGSNIAIAIGSRGIANIKTIVKNVVNFIKEKGANPFIVPAMGSHGGATAEGQKKVLQSFASEVVRHVMMHIVFSSTLASDNVRARTYSTKHPTHHR